MPQSATPDERSCPSCMGQPATDSPSLWQDRRVRVIFSSALLLGVGLLFERVFNGTLAATLLFLLTAIITGYPIARGGVEALIRHRRLSIDFLIVLASIGSFAIGHREEGAAVVFLFYIAEWLESHASDRAQRSIVSLMTLAPDVARVTAHGEPRTVPVQDVEIGAVIIVKPGEKVPLDGVILRGSTSINQAPITGESVPVVKRVGDEVYAGTINQEGYLEIQVTKWASETVLSKIITLVDEAQRDKSPTEIFIDRFATYYTPSVLLLAGIVAIVPALLFGLSFTEWLYRALVLLVVSCPCALAISTPVAMVSSLTSAAKNGVLIKGSQYIEAMDKVRVVAFDKTGTLTEGRLEVTDVIGFGYPKEEVLLKAACIEALSEHPIAQAVMAAVSDTTKLRALQIQDFRAVTGKGAICAIDGQRYYVGNRRMFTERGIAVPREDIGRLEQTGKTVILVGTENDVIGLIAVRDQIRETARPSVQALKQRRIRTEMITGDNERTAKAIADIIGVDEFHAELLPGEKVNMIGNHLATEFGHVAMVGDGVNDAPALARADVGIAMGIIGSDVALATADIALIQDDLSKLPYLLKLSQKTMAIVKQNVIASLLVKGSFAILAFPGLVTLWLAVAVGDMGLSLAVILNAMRLAALDA